MTIGQRSRQMAVRLLSIAALFVPLAACSGDIGPTVKRAAFSSSEFGVSVSPRVTRNAHPPRGGGRYSSQKPYVVRGVKYEPLVDPIGYVATGHASWYGADFHGRRTANGEIFSANAISGAHPTLPLPCYVRVTNLSNGRSLLVRINDRGPYMAGRLIDLSATAAKMLDLIGKGTGEVQVQFVAMAPLNGDDTRMLKGSLNRLTRVEQNADVRYAFAEEPRDVLEGLDLRGSVVSYADTEEDLSSAELAIGMLMEGQGEAVNLTLGAFASDLAAEIATEFAMLGAVDETPVVTAGGADATRLTLVRLKPGASHDDALALAEELGLSNLVSD
jgi:rare lipoprotein A